MATDRIHVAGALTAMLAATVVAVMTMGPASRSIGPGLPAELPPNLGDWEGVALAHCQDPQCGTVATAPPGLAFPPCPVCGREMDVASFAEHENLPPDTKLLRHVYTNTTGESAMVTVVITGTQRSSIHRAEWCLPGQGFSIQSTEALPAASSGLPFDVTLLTLARRGPGGTTTRPSLLYAYWFQCGPYATGSTNRRLWISGREALRLGHHLRWAYLTVALDLKGRTPEHAQPILLDVLSRLHREFTGLSPSAMR